MHQPTYNDVLRVVVMYLKGFCIHQGFWFLALIQRAELDSVGRN